MPVGFASPPIAAFGGQNLKTSDRQFNVVQRGGIQRDYLKYVVVIID
jgi:hypothetical protein